MKVKQARIASLVSYKILPAVLGGQKGIALFNKYISRQVPFICIATQNNDAKAADGYQVLNLLSNSPLRYINIFYFFTIRKIIRKQHITHLILEHPYYGWLALLLKWFTGVQLVVHSHNIEGLRWKMFNKWWWKLLWHYEKFVHQKANYNFFIQQSDLEYAVRHFKLQPQRCIAITFGIEWQNPPSAKEKEINRQTLLNRHKIPADHCLILFNGAFNYQPNINGLQRILTVINPQLQKHPEFKYTILICGKDIPATITEHAYGNVIFAGFVDDITTYFKGADIFLNPISEGGGIKTKLVEALGYNMNAVSTDHGAIGIDTAICNGKLQITDDNLNGFTENIIQLSTWKKDIPPAFFDHFYWGNIAQKAARFIGA